MNDGDDGVFMKDGLKGMVLRESLKGIEMGCLKELCCAGRGVMIWEAIGVSVLHMDGVGRRWKLEDLKT